MEQGRGPRFGFPPSLHHPTFRRYYFGLIATGFGNNFAQLAMSWQIFEMTGSPLSLGLLGLWRAVATMPVLLFGGLLADAVDRRKLMVATETGHFLVVAAILAFAVADQLSPGVFYATTVLSAFFTALANPARQAIVPNMVPDRDLANAMALNATQRSVSQIAGPPLAGILVATVGPSANYLINTVASTIMLGVMLSIRTQGQIAGGRRSVSWKAVADGFVYVRHHPIIMSMMALDFSQNFLASGRALLPVYSSVILFWPGTMEHIGAQGLGILSGATAIGSIVGGVTMSGLSNIRKAGVGVLLAISFYATCTVLFAYNPFFVVAWLLLAGQGLGDTVSHVFRLTILQLNIPDALRGRVTAVNMVATNGGPSLGTFRAGAMAEWLGTEMSVLVGGLATLAFVAGIAAFVPIVRRFEIKETDAVAAH